MKHKVSTSPVHRTILVAVLVSLFWAILFITLVQFEIFRTFIVTILASDNHISNPLKIFGIIAFTPIVLSLISLYCDEFLISKKAIYVIPAYLCFTVLHIYLHSEYGSSEDGFSEWTTFVLCMIASILFIRLAIHGHHFFYLLCVGWAFFGLEEISWGQRIFGFVTPDFFIQHNAQKETNVHNMLPFLGVFYQATFFGVFLYFTILRKFHALKNIYAFSSVPALLNTSDKLGLWFIPLCLALISHYNQFHEIVELQWAIYGALLGLLLTLELKVR